MPTTDPDGRLHIAVGIIRNSANKYLVSQRSENGLYAGKWEFPGGKVEQGESVVDALKRELAEELGIIVSESSSLLKLDFDYPERRVCLYVCMVGHYDGQVIANEGQHLSWLALDQLEKIDLLEANHSIVRTLKDISKV
ncbi:MAG: 8-oxo-dGTP diphosphatase MutT [Gammaproteobacteria bacterium]|nr:8-oxo-dGTP diphosphatase MutT [Gammaproteobacteria bacterium]